MFTLEAQNRYVPPKQEVDPHGDVLRDKPAWGAPTPGQQDVVPLAERLQHKPSYNNPELTTNIWDTGVSAEDLLLESDPHRPDFSSLSSQELSSITKEMRRDILAAVSSNAKPRDFVPEEGKAYPQAPRPYLMDMVYKYILSKGDEAAAERFVIDTVDSRSRHGFKTENILNRMFSIMPPEDLYDYWYAITQAKILPLVNPEFVDARFGSGVMGENISSLYQGWVENTPVSVDNPIPETVGWVSLVPEQKPEPWAEPEDVVPEPLPPSPAIAEPIVEPVANMQDTPKVSHQVKTIKKAGSVEKLIRVEALLSDKNDFDQFNLAVNSVMEENKPQTFFVNKFASEDGIITQCFIGPATTNTIRDLHIALDLIKKDLSPFASFTITKS